MKTPQPHQRILLVHRYYWPDVPAYAQMLHIMAQRFAAEGYDVSVFTTQPDYNGIYADGRAPAHETVAGVKIRRIGLARALNVGWFCLCLVWHCLTHRYDLMTVASFPPTVMARTARLICWLRGMKYIYHIQDLYPEVALASGLSQNGLLLKLAARVDRANCQKASRVIVLSGDMQAALARRGIATSNVRVINNFVIDKMKAAEKLEQVPQLDPSKFHVIFAGNMGRFQGLETLLEAADLLKGQPKIQFDFVGSGALKQRLQQQAAGNPQIRFYDHQPLQAVMQMTQAANLSVISLGKGVIYCAYPSKTMSYLESGARLLAIVEPDSELVEFIQENNLGTTAPQGDAQQVATVIKAEFEAWETGRRSDPEHARKVADANFGQAVILQKWVDMLDDVCGVRRAAGIQTGNTSPQPEHSITGS
jgi:colanic acid biosynthesis glycosyl transferase WcaI